MALTPAKLVQGAQLGTASAVLYTSVGNTKVTAPSFTNASSASVNLTLSIAYNGGATRVITSAQPIVAGAVYLAPELAGQVLTAGDEITGFASAAAAVNAFISGLTF